MLVVGTQGVKELYTPEHFKAWYDLGSDLHRIAVWAVSSVKRTCSPSTAMIRCGGSQVKQVVTAAPHTASSSLYRSSPVAFYRGLLCNDSTAVPAPPQ